MLVKLLVFGIWCQFVCVTQAVSNEGYLKLHITTWNVNLKKPTAQVKELLGLNESPRPDLIAVGLQEVIKQPHEAWVQEFRKHDAWSDQMAEILYPEGYHTVGTVRLVGIILNVFALDEHKDHINSLKTVKVPTGFGGLYGNKGATILHLNLYDVSVCFVNSHLPAHDEHFDDRVNTALAIDRNLRKACSSRDDYTFWFGDLNFRLNDPFALTANRIQHLALKNELEALLSRDQLSSALRQGLAFHQFQEPQITFRPTFKYYVGSNNYNLKRRPAWTDRILFLTNLADSSLKVNPLKYFSTDEPSISDHKPVQGSFQVKVTKDSY